MQYTKIILSALSSIIILLLLAGFIIKMLFTFKKNQSMFLKEIELIKANYEKELLKTQLEIQEQTFQHMSLELHDNVGQFLSLAKLQLSTIDIYNLNESIEKVNASSFLLETSIDEIRNISRSLNTENIINNGLVRSLRQLVEQIKRTGKFKVDFEITGKMCFLDDQKEVVLFRILQEALNNTVRHSNASKISILLHYEDNMLFLSLHDDGVGFNVNEVLKGSYFSSSGLKNIIKRSSLINARYEIASTPENGTTITIITPFLNEVCQQNVAKSK